MATVVHAAVRDGGSSRQSIETQTQSPGPGDGGEMLAPSQSVAQAG